MPTYNHLFLTTTYFINTIWPDPGIDLDNGICEKPSKSRLQSTESIQQLGVILDNVVRNFKSGFLYDYQKFTRNTIHCFGDPSLYFRTEPPTIITEDMVNIKYDNYGVKVNITGNLDNAYIAFHDKSSGKCVRHFGSSSSYSTSTKDALKYVDVTVYTSNSVPYTIFGHDYPGFVEETESKTRLVSFRSNRDYTTASI